MNSVNRQFLLAARPEGMIKTTDLQYHEADMPSPGQDQALVKVTHISLDPAMRGWMENRGGYMAPLEIGGMLGGTGMTAYFGLLDLGQPKPGHAVVVSGAAGATGSIVGQIARLNGCRVVGLAGSDEKCAWLSDKLGFDVAINYKTQSVRQELKQSCRRPWCNSSRTSTPAS